MPEWEERWPWDRIQTDKDTREAFLHESQPFVRHVASQASHRPLEWGRDEELSEAFIAFNEAINNFEPERGVPFLAYARVLIKRRLIDYYRKQRSSRETLPLDQTEVGLAVEAVLSLHDFQEGEQNRERAAEIKEYAQELGKWGLAFADLAQVSPKHRDSRETLLRAARTLALDQDLWQQAGAKGKVPMQALAQRTGIHPKVLERGRKYVLAVAILIANQHDYIYLREYVLPRKGEIKP